MFWDVKEFECTLRTCNKLCDCLLYFILSFKDNRNEHELYRLPKKT